jgi:hypothetical protein
VYPETPMQLTETLTLARYDQDNFGFLRIEVTAQQILGRYISAPFQQTTSPKPHELDSFTISIANRTVT